MGLSGRKEKQRIPNDPRNLTWADDAAKFGTNYLSKFGWDASKGLGAEGEGRKNTIKVSQKLDMLGIGAAQQKDPNGVAWKQSKDFEALLKRLNDSVAAEVVVDAEEDEEEGSASESEDDKKRKRKGEDDDGSKKKRKRSKDGKSKKSKKDKSSTKDKKSKREESSEESDPEIAPAPAVPRHMAHRARYIASKRIASRSTSSINEILGIAPTPSTTLSSTTDTPQGFLTPVDDGIISTSTKSVADYFREKMQLKSGNNSGISTPVTPPSPAVIVEDDAPRGGLGSRGGIGASRGGIGTSQLRAEATEDERIAEKGMSKFASLMSSSFLSLDTPMAGVPATPSFPTMSEVEAEVRSKSKKREGGTTEGREARRAEKKAKRKADKASGSISPVAEPTPEEAKAKEKEARKKARAEKRLSKAGDS